MTISIRSVILLAVSVCWGVFPVFSGASDFDPEKVLQQIEELKQKIAVQQETIQKLEILLQEQMAQSPEEPPQSEPAGQMRVKNKWIDGLDIAGDLRLRYEYRKSDPPNGPTENQDRFRHRFRLGGIWKNNTENWEIGAGLATGGYDATSTNQTWGEDSPFSTGDIRLDYVYAKHRIADFSGIMGQQEIPWSGSWVYWDSDIRPTGLTVQYRNEAGFFATLGGYGVRYYKDGNGGNTSTLFAGQVGWRKQIGDIGISGAGGYQQYDGEFSNQEAPNSEYDFQVADIYGSVTIPLRAVQLTPYGHIWKNFGAGGPIGQGQQGGTIDPAEENLGWILGFDTRIAPMKLGYSYAVIEADSVYRFLIDQDYGTGLSSTDVTGHRVSAFYEMTQNWSAGLTASFFEAYRRIQQPRIQLYQFDVLYRF